MSADMFGFSNDRARFDAGVAYREAAVADGWSVEPTYPKGEPTERAAELHKDGYVMMIFTREYTCRDFKPSENDKWSCETCTRRADDHKRPARWLYEVSVTIWGPDGLAIEPPDAYDWEVIRKNVTKCSACGAEDIPTTRVGFANRVCEKCLPAERKRVEIPGWSN